jgi:hypothetical protein
VCIRLGCGWHLAAFKLMLRLGVALFGRREVMADQNYHPQFDCGCLHRAVDRSARRRRQPPGLLQITHVTSELRGASWGHPALDAHPQEPCLLPVCTPASLQDIPSWRESNRCHDQQLRECAGPAGYQEFVDLWISLVGSTSFKASKVVLSKEEAKVGGRQTCGRWSSTTLQMVFAWC